VSELSPEALEVVRRTPPDLWRRLLRRLDQAAVDPPGGGRKITVEIALDRDGQPTTKGTRLMGPYEFVDGHQDR